MEQEFAALTRALTSLEATYEAHRCSAFSTPDTAELEAAIRTRLAELTAAVRALPAGSERETAQATLKISATWAYDTTSSYAASRLTARRAAIARFHPNAGPEQVAALLESPSIFDGGVLLGTVHRQHTEVLRLERSVLALKDLFVQMEALVASQAEPLDASERHVGSAVADTTDAVVEMRQATRIGKKISRKKKWLLAGVLIAAAASSGSVAKFVS